MNGDYATSRSRCIDFDNFSSSSNEIKDGNKEGSVFVNLEKD